MDEKTTAMLDEELKGIKSEKELEKFLGGIKETNPEAMKYTPAIAYFRKLFNEKDMSYAKVSNNSCGAISDNYLGKIYRGDKTNPTREKWLAIACSMQLTVDETNRLLKLDGMKELYSKNSADAIILFGLNNGLDFFSILELFESRGVETNFF